MPEMYQECPHHVTKETGLPASAQVREPLDGRDYDIVTTPIKAEDGTVTGYIHVSRDITEQKAFREQVFQTEKLAALGQLLAGVAHELNNPLTTVLGFSQLLLEKPELDPATRESLQRVVEAADRTRRIVSSFLTFARHHKPEKRPVDVNRLLEETLALQEYEMRVHNIQIRKELDSRLPQTRADPHQIQQVFLNLFLNAYQAMLDAHRKGTLTVRTALKSSERLPHGDYIEIAIADDGSGIPPDRLHKVFDPFFTTKEVGKGTGLGLSIAYGIIREHGGNLYARSRPGQGTTMVIELPLLRGTGDPREEKGLPVTHPFRARILVVDDEETIAQFVRTALQTKGHQVEIAGSGEAAWELISHTTYDLILTDIKMPGQGGVAFYRKAQEVNPHLAKRFIFITGDIASPRTEMFLSQTGCRYLAKPFSVDDLYRAVEEVLLAQ
jgi:two-component system NtrC family sensor kinase